MQPRKRDISNITDTDMTVTVKGKRPYLVAREAMHQVSNMEKILASTREKLCERDQEIASNKKRSAERENLLISANKKIEKLENAHEAEIRCLNANF